MKARIQFLSLGLSFCFERSEAGKETAVDCRGCAGFWLHTYLSCWESIPIWKGQGTSAGFVFWPISVKRGRRLAWLPHAEGFLITWLVYPHLSHFCPPVCLTRSFLSQARSVSGWSFCNRPVLFGRRAIHAPMDALQCVCIHGSNTVSHEDLLTLYAHTEQKKRDCVYLKKYVPDRTGSAFKIWHITLCW